MNPFRTTLALGCLAACLGVSAWSADTIGSKIDDSVLTGRVKAALIANPDTKARQIDVDTLNGVVTLSGSVDDDSAKMAAESTAKSIAGVGSVENRLMVKDSTSVASTAGSSTGPVVHSATTSALNPADGSTASTTTTTTTTEATVPSSSTTHSPSTGAGTSGDTVVAAATPSAEMNGRISQALKADQRTANLQIDVVNGSGSGTVVLSGTVSTEADRSAAAEVARGVSGVSKVENRITVKSSAKPY